MSRVLITGGAGFIGCRLARALLEQGHSVSVLDNLHPQVHPHQQLPVELPAAADFLPGDVAAASSWGAVLAATQPTTIIHLAAETGTGQSLTEPMRHASVNVLGTAALIEALERRVDRPGQLVLSSTRAVYGDGAWTTADGRLFYPAQRSAAQLVQSEWDHRHPDGAEARPLVSAAASTTPAPANVYAATKLAQEHLLTAWCRAREIPLSILRLQNVYGPGQSPTNSYTGVLTHFARTALRGGAIDVYEDGEITRDFVYIDDVVAALVACVARPSTRLVDIGSGTATTVARVARKIAAACRAPDPVISGRYRLGDVRAASCDIEAARVELGYEPRWTIDEGIAALLDWMPTSRDYLAEPA